jgi:ribosome-associated toxin RatA of RatAB toxin-antitoxin module
MTKAEKATNYYLNKNLTINAPLDKVWSILADFNDVYTWAPSVAHSYSLNQKYQQIGAARHCEIKGFGAIEEVVTQWQEKSGFTYTVSDLGPLTGARSRWAITQISELETKIDVELAYNLKFSIIGKLLHSLLMKSKLADGLNSTLLALKTRAESGKLVRPLIVKELADSTV